MNGFGTLLVILAAGQTGASTTRLGDYSSTTRPSLPPYQATVNPTGGLPANRLPEPSLPVPVRPLPTGPATRIPNSQPNFSLASAPQLSTSYGWDEDPVDGKLYYIIQVSPAEVRARLLDSASGNPQNLRGVSGKPSDMPHQLVGRVQRIVWRIGVQPLPQNPPISVIAARPQLSTQEALQTALETLPYGNMASVEQAANTVPVQRTLPAGTSLPSTRGNSFSSTAPAPLGRPATRPQGNGGLGTTFLNAAQGGSEPNAPAPLPFGRTPPANTPRSALPGSDLLPQNLTADTRNAATPSAAPRQPNYQTPNIPNTVPGRFDNRQPPSLAASTPAATTSGRDWNQPSYDPQTAAPPRFGERPNSTMTSIHPTPGYQSPLDYRGSTASSGQYPPQSQPYAGQPASRTNFPAANPLLQRPAANTQVQSDPTRIAMNTPSVDAQRRLDATLAGKLADAISASDKEKEASSAAKLKADEALAQVAVAHKTIEEQEKSLKRFSFMQAFFVLSLIVNLYVATLIRKLLNRYRTLLSSVRSQGI